MTKVWGIIPARGGSKSIKNKNLCTLTSKGGVTKTLTEWVISKAVQSLNVDRWILTSDSPDILSQGIGYNIELDARPKKWARDYTLVHEMICNYLMPKYDDWPDIIVLIQPTSPFFTSSLIEEVVHTLSKSKARGCYTVTEVSHNNHEWNQRKTGNFNLISFVHQEQRINAHIAQAKPKRFRFGNICAIKKEVNLSYLGFFPPYSEFIKIDRWQAIDIDTKEDLIEAQCLINGGYLDV